ncbi:putative disease resistance RPP13-like protein 1 [Zingiber officinale]|uniref:putative disease resistance RPP13-like protein 1 n=1 Tax=Zingiber officinale TaxID=94328 RepID=UPI001C4CDE98|nr:putative disease resistance RPP13-like protein 1 [Zingiber officinale]
MALLFTLSDLGRLVVSLIDSLVEKLRRDEVHRLQMLPEVGVVLRDLETRVIQIRHIISPAENSFAIATDQQIKLELKGLLMQLKNTVYDGEDLVEEIEHDVLHHEVDQHQYEASSQSSSSFNSSIAKRTSAPSPVKLPALIKAADSSVYKLRKINLRLGRIATAIAKIIQVTNSVGADDGQKIHNADSVSSNTTSFSVDGKMYGRDGEFNTLRQLLLKPSVGSGSSNGSLSVVAIFGVGGVGKTTLAQQLYRDTSITEYFQLKIWVYLSENFTVKRLIKKILQSANIDFPDHINLDMLQVVVKKKIASKRFLLVIDDLWNAEWDMHKWGMLFAMLRPGVPSSKVLLTTRFPRLPTVASNECAFHLDRMDEEEFWEFFKLCAFGSQSSQEKPPLIDIAKKMVSRLNGLPLAARMVGEWVSIRDTYRVHVQVPYLQDLHKTLRPLSVFAEFVKPERLMDIFVNERLRTLIFSSMKEPWCETKISANHLFNRLKCIRVLILHDCGMIELPWTINRLIHLRYLDISDNFGIQQLPDSLSYLHNLQYFDLNNCQVQTFPAGITNLINLRQLISVDEIISKINNIGKLINLQTLPTFKVLKGDGHKLTELSSLTQLHGRLRILNLGNVEDKMEASAAKLHDKVHLDELVLAWTSDQNSSFDDNALHASEEILEELQPHSKLKSLTIRGYKGARAPSWVHTETLASLETLRLENCGRWEDVSFIRQLLHLRSLYLKGIPAMKQTTQELFGPIENKFFQGLKELVLEGMDLLDELSSDEVMFCGVLDPILIRSREAPHPVGVLVLASTAFEIKGNHFPCLEELKFSNMSEWEEWTWTGDSELFPCLLVLKIEDCPKLKMLPPLPPSLMTLELWQNGLVELPGLWNKINGSSSNMIASLSKLYVSECPNLRMLDQGLLFHDLPNIESIEIHECQELLWLPVKRFKEFTSLKNLSVKNCPMLMSSTEYKSDELLLPPSIQKLTLLDCGNLSEPLPRCLLNLPSISQLEIGHPPSQG